MVSLLVMLVSFEWTIRLYADWYLLIMLCIFVLFCLWFNYCFAHECIPCLFPKFTTKKTFHKPLNFVYFIEFYLRLCWLVSLALETISGTNIFGAVAGDEVEAHFPWDTYQFSSLSGGLKPTLFEGYFSPKLSQWLLEEWEPGADLLHHYIQGFQTLNRSLKQQEN